MQVPLLTAPLSWQGPMHFHYRDSNFTIAITAKSILSLSTSYCSCMRGSCDLIIVSMQYVDDVVIGAPYAITKDLLDHFQVRWTLMVYA